MKAAALNMASLSCHGYATRSNTKKRVFSRDPYELRSKRARRNPRVRIRLQLSHIENCNDRHAVTCTVQETSSNSTSSTAVAVCVGSLDAALQHIQKAQKEVKKSIIVKQLLQNERKDHNVTRQKLANNRREISDLQKKNDELKRRNSELQKYKTESMLYRLERKDHNVTKQKLQILETHFHSLKQCNSKLHQENDELKQRNSKLQKYKTDSMLYRLERIKELNDSELYKLQDDLKKGLQTVENERDNRLRSEIGDCVICMESLKDTPPVCFIDGCDHVAICSDCISENDLSECPLCRVPFTITKILNICGY